MGFAFIAPEPVKTPLIAIKSCEQLLSLDVESPRINWLQKPIEIGGVRVRRATCEKNVYQVTQKIGDHKVVAVKRF